MTKVVAMCRCGEPLVHTFAFSGAEFYCLSCGSHYGWREPDGKVETPELIAWMKAVEAEFVELGGRDLLGGGLIRRDCETCVRTGQVHLGHATAEERAAHERALGALKLRVRKGALDALTGRLRAIREAVMADADARHIAEGVVEAILEEVVDLADDHPAPEMLGGVRLYGPDDGLPSLTVGELRERLRFTIGEIAARDVA